MPDHNSDILDNPAVQMELLRRDVKALTESIASMKQDHGDQIRALSAKVETLTTTWATTSNLAKVLTWIVGIASGVVAVWGIVKH